MSHVDDGALHAYLDGELAPVERARLEAHVAECPPCRARLDEERALIARASELLGLAGPAERPAPPLHQLRHPRLAWRLRIPLAWAASVVLALALGYYMGGSSYVLSPAREVAFADSVAPFVATPAADSYGSLRRSASEPTTPGVVAQAPSPRPAPPAGQLRDQAAGRVAAKAREESADTVAGVVPIQPRAELRPVTPAPPEPVVRIDGALPRAEADIPTLRGRLVATEWPIIRREPARQILGTDPVGIPGLALREIRRSPANDGVVLVEQQLDSATVIQVFQRRVEAERVARNAATERLARFVGSLRVEIAGPLTPDSLNRLLEQVKPLP